ncbi:MAG: hypothetical protein RQ982_05315 [Gammaproteobacteria bacterium]|nr:hypothetical protein [Gammaproteobacteria bacterium]
MLAKKQLLSALILSGAMILSGSATADEKFPMGDKLQQCELAFEKAHSGELSQAEAAKAKSEHRKLMLEILENINKRNTEISTKTGEAMSNEEIVNNFKVMGRLLEMVALDHQPQKAPWHYAY